jgi:hypothetical protein
MVLIHRLRGKFLGIRQRKGKSGMRKDDIKRKECNS